MDFFARQDQARRNTKWLVFYFLVAVVLIIASVYFAFLFIFQGAASYQHPGPPPVFTWWNPKLFLLAAGGTLAVITSGSLIKTAQLSSGGRAVAESLGGRLVSPGTNDPSERKLLNVIEEMAIASGVPMPQVYVLDREHGINAFAAGHNLSDAVIGVTRGCITTLKRDELQGVIGHEFSHILNGDMRLNLQLMGIIFGILCLAVVGRILLNSRGSSRDKNPLPLIGLVLILFGWIGVFFGRLIQSAVSRQREFLADASAVQFTRNPAGLSGALQKIAALAEGSRLESEHAAEASHMFFGNPMRRSFFNVFATHPPLEERIRAIDPNWDGTLPKVSTDESEALAAILEDRRPAKPAFPPVIPGFPGGPGGLAGAAVAIGTHSVLPSLGNPTPQHLRYAVELRESLPENLRQAARTPSGACALLYALLLSDDPALRQSQLDQLATRTTSATQEQTAALWPDLSTIAHRARLPVVSLTLPALKQLTQAEFDRFHDTLAWLIESDEQIVLFEFVLQKIIQHQVEPAFTQAPRAAIQYYSLRPLLPDCAVLLSALAHTGETDSAEVARAFQTGVPHLRASDLLALLPSEQAGLTEIGNALDRLALAAPQIKKNLLEACAYVVGADGVIQENEAELLRGIAEALECPIPPFINLSDDR